MEPKSSRVYPLVYLHQCSHHGSVAGSSGQMRKFVVVKTGRFPAMKGFAFQKKPI
jgi:hypothetical protein